MTLSAPYFLLLLVPIVLCITPNQLMDLYRARQAQKEARTPEAEWRKAVIDSAPPIGFVAGEPIHSRVWDRIRPGEPVFFDDNGVPYEYRRRG